MYTKFMRPFSRLHKLAKHTNQWISLKYRNVYDRINNKACAIIYKMTLFLFVQPFGHSTVRLKIKQRNNSPKKKKIDV